MIEEKELQDFIKQELWELVDAVVDAKYYGGPKLNPEMIAAKERKLIDLVGVREVPEDSPSLHQAEFIINNALREYDREKREG